MGGADNFRSCEEMQQRGGESLRGVLGGAKKGL